MTQTPARKWVFLAALALGVAASDGAVAEPILVLTSSNELLRVDSSAPEDILSTVEVGGLAASDELEAVDVRPATAELYGLGGQSRLYRIDPSSGDATAVGGLFDPLLDGNDFGFDFVPTTDVLRVVSDAEQSFRLDPVAGTVLGTDSALAFAAGDANENADPKITACAHTGGAGSASTTIYCVDTDLDVLVRLGSVGGDPTPPSSGALTTVGPLGLDVLPFAGLDISDRTGVAYATFVNGSFERRLFSVDLSTGAATDLGTIGTGSFGISGLAVATAIFHDGFEGGDTTRWTAAVP